MADGRFAPTPSGPLHFGSLVAAVASYLQAKAAPVGATQCVANPGKWFLRVEDLDRPREVAGAAADQLRTLERFGFEWDGPVLYQSRRHDAYAEAFARLDTYPCGCTRSDIADLGVAGIDGPVYPGTCRDGIPDGKEARAWRVRTHSDPVAFDDAIQGRIEQAVETAVGDFVVKRADGSWAYQLAVVVDDAFQGVTAVVRGADLLASTPRQIHLQRALGLPTPLYMHVPIVTDADGEKLSKSKGAGALAPGEEARDLHRALTFLGQSPPDVGLADLWGWAMSDWDPARIRPVEERIV